MPSTTAQGRDRANERPDSPITRLDDQRTKRWPWSPERDEDRFTVSSQAGSIRHSSSTLITIVTMATNRPGTQLVSPRTPRYPLWCIAPVARTRPGRRPPRVEQRRSKCGLSVQPVGKIPASPNASSMYSAPTSAIPQHGSPTCCECRNGRFPRGEVRRPMTHASSSDEVTVAPVDVRVPSRSS